MQKCHYTAAAIALLAFTLSGHPVQSEDAPPELSSSVQPAALSAEQLQSSINELSNRNDLPAGARETALANFKNALSYLESVRASAAATASFKKIVDTGSASVADLRRQLSSVDSSAAALTSNANADFSDLQQFLTEAQVDAATQRGRVHELDEAQRTQLLRYSGARNDLADERRKFDAADASRRGAPPPDDDSIVTRARLAARDAARLASTARIAMFEQELLSLPLRRRILSAQRDLAVKQLACAEKRVNALKRTIRERLLANAQEEQRAAENMERELAGKTPTLEAYARETTAYCRQMSDLAERLQAADNEFSESSAATAKIYEIQQSAQQLLEVGGSSAEFGQSLRELRDRMPRDADVSEQLAASDRAMLEARIQRIHLQEKLTGPESGALDSVSGAEPLVAGRKRVLQRLLDAYGQYLGRVAEVRESLKELNTGVDRLSLLFDEKLMWLPSAPPVGLPWLQQVSSGVTYFVNPRGWESVAHALGREITGQPLPGLLLALFAAALLFSRRRIRARVIDSGSQSSGVSARAFNWHYFALATSLLLAVTAPLLFSSSDTSGAPFAAALGRGIWAAALMSMVLAAFQIMSLPNGVFAARFSWSGAARERLAHNLTWLAVLLIPAVFVMFAAHVSSNDDYNSGLGRLAFIAGSMALSVFAYRVFHPRRGVSALLPAEHIVQRASQFWFPLIVAAPMLLAVFAAYGYFEPAVRVQVRLIASGLLAVVGSIAYGLVMHWVAVAHERLVLFRTTQDRKREADARGAQLAARGAGEATPRTLNSNAVDLAAVNAQTRTLLKFIVSVAVIAALCMVWRGIVPALSVLDQIPVWSRMAGNDPSAPVSAVTLLGLLKALAAFVLMIVAVRNIAGVLEIVALQRLTLDAGTAYAVITVSRYVIIAIGTIVMFHALGVEWSGLQWILASLSVGLGFGLQEIVANFFAGLIILFERRIRVGDTITVQQLTGTVSRIQIRATTVVDWDNREILVPNKSFINDNVINWTLSDPVTRLVLKVGVAYGSDVAKAQSVMLDAAKANPLVMENPAPTVFFTGFGDNALNFEIRIFVRELSKRMPLTHELHVAIERAMRENGIEIPFPQLDLHIRRDPKPENK